MLHSYRPLMRFWAAVLLLCGAGVVALEALGPPPSGALVSGAFVSGALVSAPVPPVQEAAKAPPPPAEGAAPAAEVPLAGIAAPVLSAGAVAAVAGSPPSLPTQPGPRKAPPPKAAPAPRGTLSGDGGGLRQGGADRRSPARDIWGNPLLPPAGGAPAGGWVGRPSPGGRGEGGYIGVFTVGPDGTRSFRAGP